MRKQNSSILKQWEEYQRRLAAGEPIPCGPYPLPPTYRGEEETHDVVRN